MPPKSNRKGKGDSSKPKAPKGNNTDSKGSSSKQSTLSSFVNAKPKKKSMRKAAQPLQNNRGEEIRGPEVLTGPDYVSALESVPYLIIYHIHLPL